MATRAAGCSARAPPAYRQAARDAQDAYPLINAATLSLLAGDIDLHTPRPRGRNSERLGCDTPYYQAATRAEALLVLGRIAEARSALAEAVARGPRPGRTTRSPFVSSG